MLQLVCFGKVRGVPFILEHLLVVTEEY